MSTAGELDARVAAVLRDSVPFAFCDECLAIKLAVSPAAARAAALSLATASDFERVVRVCYRCDRAHELTAVR